MFKMTAKQQVVRKKNHQIHYTALIKAWMCKVV